MQTLSNLERMNLSNGKALRRAREQLRVTRIELGNRIGLSAKAIEKYENGRSNLSEVKISQILSSLGIGEEHFQRVKKGRALFPTKKKRVVTQNDQRRSYQKRITKEVKVLRTLRGMRDLSQDQASSVCGYSRPSIGHIENGRIELDRERINHIISSYGFVASDFDRMMNEDVLRDEMLEKSFEKMKSLSEEKLKVIQSLLMTM